MITGLAHVCFSVKDLDRSIAFYCDKLGLRKAFDFVDENGRRYGVYIKVGPRAFIELFSGDPAAPSDTPSYKHVCLEVDDIHATAAALRAKGVTVGDIKLGLDQSYQAWITDPDGNKIEMQGYTKASWQGPHLG